MPRDPAPRSAAYVSGITETDLKKIVLAIQLLAAGRSKKSTLVSTGNCDDPSQGRRPMVSLSVANMRSQRRGIDDVRVLFYKPHGDCVVKSGR